jgi:hypothetical protein
MRKGTIMSTYRPLAKHASRATGRRALVALAVLGTVAVAVSAASSSHANAALTSRRPAVLAAPHSVPADSKPKPDQNLCAPRLPWDTVRQQTALGLHLTVAQIRIQVLRGKPIQVVAAGQRLSLRQLHILELHALQVGNERWIKVGCNTSREGAAYMRIYSHMTLAQLNEEFTHLFVES